MSTKALALTEEVVARLSRGKDPAEFASQLGTFLKNPEAIKDPTLGTFVSENEIPELAILIMISKGWCQDFGRPGRQWRFMPEFPETYKQMFPHAVLVDPRRSLEDACRSLGVNFKLGGDIFCPVADPHDFRGRGQIPRPDYPYWIRCQNGRKNNGKDARDPRAVFAEYETDLNATEVLCLYAQAPWVIYGHNIFCHGTVDISRPNRIATLGFIQSGPSLYWESEIVKFSHCGLASRGV